MINLDFGHLLTLYLWARDIYNRIFFRVILFFVKLYLNVSINRLAIRTKLLLVMSDCNDLNPRKYFVEDLIKKQPPFDVWIQGTVTQSVEDNILIINDSNKVKVENCIQAQGSYKDGKLVRKGDYCCIIGTVVKTNGLPVIKAVKLIDLSNETQMKEAWKNEVKEASLVLEGKYQPEFK